MARKSRRCATDLPAEGVLILSDGAFSFAGDMCSSGIKATSAPYGPMDEHAAQRAELLSPSLDSAYRRQEPLCFELTTRRPAVSCAPPSSAPARGTEEALCPPIC